MNQYQESIPTSRVENSFAFPPTPPPCHTDCQSSRFNTYNEFSITNCNYKRTWDMVPIGLNSASGVESPQREMLQEMYTGRWTESNQCNEFSQNYHLHRYLFKVITYLFDNKIILLLLIFSQIYLIF